MKNDKESFKNWNKTKKNLIQKFAILTDKSVLYLECKQDELVELLKVKLGKSEKEILKLISNI